jgi:hypothetical protein
MTDPEDPLERVRAANPVPVPIEPDWEQVKEHVGSASPSEADSGQDAPGGVRVRAALTPQRYRPAPIGGNGRAVRRVLGALALSVTAAAGVLVVLAPWGGSSGFLARAAAALAPQPGAILYERWEHIIAPEPGNPLRKAGVTLGPEQLWIEDDSPHHYRALLEPGSSSSASAASAGADLASIYGVTLAYAGPRLNLVTGRDGVLTRLQRRIAGEPLELGGTTEQKRPGEVPRTLTFLPPNELLSARLGVTLGAVLPGAHYESIEDGTDPVSALRAAIAEGRAHTAGTAQLDGRTVERINLEVPQHPPAGAPPLPANAPPATHSGAYAYVEPNSLYPVEIVFPSSTYRFLAYEYLPATSANLALSNIRAQHPHATILGADAATPRASRHSQLLRSR